MNIYLASSWRNRRERTLQPGIVHVLRRCGHTVYDFRDSGFSWREIDPNWEHWTPTEWRTALQHPIAKRGYANDIKALRQCDAVLLLLPAGHSSAWEFGYAMGQGKRGFVLALDNTKPELMFREAQIFTTMNELFDAFGEPAGHDTTNNRGEE